METSAGSTPSSAAGPKSGAPAPRRVLILMSNTGGGHRASALALKAGFEQHTPGGFDVQIIDLLSDHTFWPLNKSPEIYAGIATNLPWLWGVAYSTERSPSLARAAMRLAAHLANTQVSEALTQHRPDLVISVHPLAQELTLHALKQLPADQRPPFATVVTDLATAHPLWLHPEVDGCFVASDGAHKQALAAGVPSARLFLLGLPIRPAFAEPPLPRRTLRANLKMDPTLPAVLVMGGGDGVGPVEEIATHLDTTLSAGEAPAGQVVVICGRNEALKERLEARQWQVPHHVLGFVDRVPDWMFACDAIVTKAGPGTMAEAFICGLPLILSGYIPGQEKGNIDFVSLHEAGAYVPDPAAIAATVTRWFGPAAQERARLAANARALGKPHATREIVSNLIGLLDVRSGAPLK